MSLQDIGKRIYHLRTEILKLPQLDFSQRIGVAQGNLSALEKGQSLPSCFFLWGLHAAYKTNLHWLFTGQGEPLCHNQSSPSSEQ